MWGLAAADVTGLPFKDDHFDLVICAEVLEHIKDYKQAIQEIVRVLKPGRNLVVSVPRYWPERICWVLSTDYHTAKGGHVRIFRQAQLITELQNAGLKQWFRHYSFEMGCGFPCGRKTCKS